MTSFAARSLIGFFVLAMLAGPAGMWPGAAPAMRFACDRGFTACRIGRFTVPVAETSSVLGRISRIARHDAAGHFAASLRKVLAAGMKETTEGARGAALTAR
ncbi:MAG TPA: hypothetical protein VF449_12490 [Parvibaculum sp.]